MYVRKFNFVRTYQKKGSEFLEEPKKKPINKIHTKTVRVVVVGTKRMDGITYCMRACYEPEARQALFEKFGRTFRFSKTIF